MKDQKTIDLFLYWNRLRNGRAAPARCQIEPADIRTLLGDTFILERDSQSRASFRLAGTRLCALFGRELKGFVFASLWEDSYSRVVTRLVDNAFGQDGVVLMRTEAESESGRIVQMETLLLPLAGVAGDGNGARVLGSSVTLEKPFWLGVDPIVNCRLQSLRVMNPDQEPLFLKNRPEVPVPSLLPKDIDMENMPAPSSGRKVRHLMVLDGGLN